MKKIKLGDLLTIKHGYAFKSEHYLNDGNFALVTLANISESNNFQFDKEKLTYYEASFPQDVILKEGDLILPMTEQVIGLLGNSAFIPAVDGFSFVLNQRVGKVIPSSNVDKYYLHYLLATKEVKTQLEYRASGTKQRNISPENIYDVTVLVPDLPSQKKIGSVLYSLEQKINLNKKINATLESMAKTLYDYWFVQFDFPDKNGKPYKTSGGKMIYNSELRRDIPVDWELGKLSKLIKSVTTGLNPRDNFVLNTGGDIKYVTVKNLTLNGRIDFSNCDCVDKDARNLIHERSNISKGDVLFASIAPLGRCFLIQEEPCNWEINESVFSIRPSNFTTSEFLYMYLKSNGFVKLASSSSTGSIFKGIRINTLMETPTVIPPKNISEQFKNKLSKLLSKLNQSDEESRRLAELRDWLLPMLMNGQIQFKET